MISDNLAQIIIALIGLAGIIATAKYKDVQNTKKNAEKPRDRMDSIYDGYEGLIKQQQVEIDRRGQMIEHLQLIVDQQRRDVETSQNMINTLRIELEEAKDHSQQLRDQLESMKKDYAITKTDNK